MKTLFALAVLTAAAAQAAGFATDTHGARATGMGTAVVAHIDDASAAFYNPAGLSQGKGLRLQLGDTVILPSLTFTGPSGNSTSNEPKPVPPPHLYASFGLTDEASLGLGLFSAYGSSASWPASWDGRFRVTESALSTYFINPELAYRLHERFKLGAGYQLVRATVRQKRALGFVDSEGALELGGATWGHGANLGFQLQLVPGSLSLGGTWRSAAKLPFQGSVHFEGVPVELASRLKDQAAKTEITLPESYSLGVAYYPVEGLRLGFDASYVAWSSFRELVIDFDDPELRSQTPKKWFDVWNYHLGGEYTVNQQLRARAGLVYDPSPVPADTLTPDMPDSTRIKLAAGVGYRMEPLDVDLGYQLVILNKVESTAPQLPGTYSGIAHVAGLTLSYRM